MQAIEDTCPLCREVALVGSSDDLYLINCERCHKYRIGEEALSDLHAKPLTPEQIARNAAFNWQHPGRTIHVATVRRTDMPLLDETERFDLVIAELLRRYGHDTFTLNLTDRELLGRTGCASSAELRKFLFEGAGEGFLPVLTEKGEVIGTVISPSLVKALDMQSWRSWA